jgi:hypothetical protein
MKRATPQMRNIAKRLLASEIGSAAKAGSAAVFPVADKLRPHLAALMGNGGVRALLGRSLALASAEIPWLEAAHDNQDGDFEGLDALAAGRDPAEFLDGRVVLLAQLLGLLVAFIGPSLTSRLIGEVWPQIPLRERDFGKENDREKAR